MPSFIWQRWPAGSAWTCRRIASTQFPTNTPVLVDLKPTGQGYMEDFFAAGGVGGVLRRLAGVLDLDAATVTGERLGARLPGDDEWIDPAVIRPSTRR